MKLHHISRWGWQESPSPSSSSSSSATHPRSSPGHCFSWHDWKNQFKQNLHHFFAKFSFQTETIISWKLFSFLEILGQSPETIPGLLPFSHLLITINCRYTSSSSSSSSSSPSTAARLHVFLLLVNSIEQKLWIQWENRLHRNFNGYISEPGALREMLKKINHFFCQFWV